MGRKTSTTLQRFGIPVLSPNRYILQPYLPFELRSSRVDRFGWDRTTPAYATSLGKQQYRLSFQVDLALTQILTHYLQAIQLQLLRLRIKANGRHLAVHVFYLSSSEPTEAPSLTIPFEKQNVFRSVLRKSLSQFLKPDANHQSGEPIVLIWHPVNLTNRPLAALTNHLRPFKNIFIKKDKLLFYQGLQLLAIIPTYNCNQAFATWVARCLQVLKRPILVLNLIKRASGYWKVQTEPCYLKGFQLKVKGRLGGVDIATSKTISWGTLSRQRLSLGVTEAFAPAYTVNGLYGIRIYTHYF